MTTHDVDYPISAYRLFCLIEGWRDALKVIREQQAAYEEIDQRMGSLGCHASIVAIEECVAQVEDLIKAAIPPAGLSRN